MEKKNNKTLLIICILFGLIILGLGGYLVYDKFIANDEETKESDKKDDEEKKISKKDLLGTYRYEDSNSDTEGCGVYDSVALSLMDDNTFVFEMIYSCSESAEYTGTYKYEDGKLSFNATHFYGEDMSDPEFYDIPMSIYADPDILTTKESYIKIVDKDTLKYGLFAEKEIKLTK